MEIPGLFKKELVIISVFVMFLLTFIFLFSGFKGITGSVIKKDNTTKSEVLNFVNSSKELRRIEEGYGDMKIREVEHLTREEIKELREELPVMKGINESLWKLRYSSGEYGALIIVSEDLEILGTSQSGIKKARK